MQSITPPLIAVIGSDGSGKSTVCEHLITVVEKYGAAERVHLGKQAGNVGRAVTKLPLMGKSLHKTIERNQVKTAKKLPGTCRIWLAAPCTGGLPRANYAAEISIMPSN
jgi:ABC-type Mn2+/Zn2+ transport system ATPase subunit